jgi:hypothetical protein
MTNQQATPTDWNDFVSDMNEQFMEAMEQNMQAQASFVEQWSEAVESQRMDQPEMDEGLQGYKNAYETWMDAADQMVDRVNDSMEGEEVDPSEFRDIWLNTANSAFKDVMETTAFAAWTGSTVQQMMQTQRQADQVAEDTLSQLGFATDEQIAEVGDRLVEMERRQHAVEQKLDRVLEHLED